LRTTENIGNWKLSREFLRQDETVLYCRHYSVHTADTDKTV